MKKTLNKIPLISEDYPDDYNSYKFISLIQYGKEKILTVIDNTNDTQMKCFVLDMCGPEGISEQSFLEVANHWFINNSKKYPLSIDLAKNGLGIASSKILRTFNIEYVSRVIGPIPNYSMNGVETTKRKRKRVFSTNEANMVVSQFIDY